MALVRITLEDFLDQKRQAVEPLAHVCMAGGKPHLDPTRDRDHLRPPSNASASAAARAGVTPSGKRRTRPLRSTSSITAGASASAGFSCSQTLLSAGATAIGTNWHSVDAPSASSQ